MVRGRKHNTKKYGVLTLLVVTVFVFATLITGCGSLNSVDLGAVTSAVSNNDNSTQVSEQSPPSANGNGSRGATTNVLKPTPSGDKTAEEDGALIDYSNTNDGYVMIKYTGDNPTIKVRITGPDQNPYTYDLIGSDYTTYPLTVGSGKYTVEVLEHMEGDSYAFLLTEDIDAQIKDEFTTFLYPSQYVNFNENSNAVKIGAQLAQSANNEMDVITNIFKYVTKEISYDYDKAAAPPSGYVPDLEEVLQTKKGICFDYAALTVAMLRSQGIPSKLAIGYASSPKGDVYHAWVYAYSKESGKLAGIIKFDGNTWTLIDPTFSSTAGVAVDFAGDGQNYRDMYIY